ncbi:restriction endonuclease [Prevotella sp. tc2-28]|uniref:restriction endonuclease n=1 Tax=Prevotella sp. tc2-28 TaxID=1761888 RepID=UPI0015A1BAFB|nr:restriction endonuclease [Prevotella sp. tc2-28]
MKLIKQNEGTMSFAAIKEKIPTILTFNDWESANTSEKTPQPRWFVNSVFYSVEYVKAGLIRKDAGVWYLTEEGEKALALTPQQVFEIAHTAYRQYQKENDKHETIDEDVEEVSELTDEIIVAEAESTAQEGISKRIKAMNPYEFQDLCATLLRGMGYYTPFIAPKGKDGGIDIVAYENAAGVGQRIIAQVKHMPTTAIDVTVVRNLAALLKKDGDTGIVFSSGTFTNEAIRFAREHKSNIRLIGSTELVKLWIDNYELLSEEDRLLLPLKAVYYVLK